MTNPSSQNQNRPSSTSIPTSKTITVTDPETVSYTKKRGRSYGPMIQCENFIFKPSKNGVVNFSYELFSNQFIPKSVATKSSSSSRSESDVDDCNSNKDYYEEEYLFENTITDEQVYYSENNNFNNDFDIESVKKRPFESDSTELKTKSVKWDPELVIKDPETESSSNSITPLIPEIKSFKMSEIIKLGYKKNILPNGRIEYIMTPEIQEFLKSSPEYKEYLKRIAGTEIILKPNVQLKIVSNENKDSLKDKEDKEDKEEKEDKEDKEDKDSLEDINNI